MYNIAALFVAKYYQQPKRHMIRDSAELLSAHMMNQIR
jgi:hypothetical protein